jgi:hypothetical protein
MIDLVVIPIDDDDFYVEFAIAGGATLDDVCRDPAHAAALSIEERSALIVQAAAVLAALGGTLAMVRDDDEPDRLLSVAEASSRLSMSTDYLYKHGRELPFFVAPPNGARAIRFSARGIARYLAEQSAGGA